MAADRVIEVSAGLLFRDGKLLLTQRRKGDHLENLWEFPGGKKEPTETWETCLVRELKEELGIVISVGDLVDSVLHSYPEKTVFLRFYLCRLVSGEPAPIACQDLVWVSREELDHYTFPEADRQLIQKLKNNSGLWK